MADGDDTYSYNPRGSKFKPKFPRGAGAEALVDHAEEAAITFSLATSTERERTVRSAKEERATVKANSSKFQSHK
jgi:hypothetical protein